MIKARAKPGASRHADATLEPAESLVAELRARPDRFPDTASLAARMGRGGKRVSTILLQHFHSTPEDLLGRARLDAAKRLLLAGDAPPARIARAVGYDAPASFHDAFLAGAGLTPAAFRALRTGRSFSIRLPDDHSPAHLRRALSRDRHSVTERLEGDVYTAAIRLGAEAHVLTMDLAPDHARVSIDRPTTQLPRAHAMVAGLLGLGQGAAAFARLARKLKLPQLVAGRPGLRISQTHTIFDGLLWAIVGQQINFAFACLLKRRLMEKAGTPMGNGLHAPPSPREVAALEPGDLLPLQFSRQKADYVISISRLIAEGKLDLEALRLMSATRVERALLAVRGLGPWSVNYLMMRSLGFADCLPLGDTGVTSGLLSLFQLEKRPDAGATRRLMARFIPFRSLATAHLWQINQPAPESEDDRTG